MAWWPISAADLIIQLHVEGKQQMVMPTPSPVLGERKARLQCPVAAGPNFWSWGQSPHGGPSHLAQVFVPRTMSFCS